MLCQFLAYSITFQSCIYAHIAVSIFFFVIGDYKILSRVPCALQKTLVYLFYI